MKTIRFTFLAVTMFLLGSLGKGLYAQYQYNGPNDGYDNRGEVTYQTFYDELSPYGQWVESPDYGYVWVPEAGDDFRPYSTNGHWVYNEEYEWLWVSDYDWGWAPFHYGRWEEDPYYGWIWVPGYEWSPAWVAWRDGGDYYGWAPLRPGINISVNFNIGSYNPPTDYWCFVPRQYVYSPRVYDYYVDRRINVNIISRTTFININFGGYNRYGYRSGPNRYEAERYCGRINPVRFRDSYTPGRTFYRNNEVSFYRPQVNRNSDRNRSYAPRTFERYDRNTAGFRNRSTDGRGGGNDIRRADDNGFRRNNDGRGNNTNVNNDDRFRQPNRNADREVRPDNGGFRGNNDRGFGNGGRIDNTVGQQRDTRVVQPERRPDVRPDVRPNGRPDVRPTDNRDIRRNDQQQPQPRNFERRNNPSRERTYQPAQERPQPERNFERREARVERTGGNTGGGNGNTGGGNGNNGGGNGRGRRF